MMHQTYRNRGTEDLRGNNSLSFKPLPFYLAFLLYSFAATLLAQSLLFVAMTLLSLG
jgi:hypothetical protein